MQDPGYWWQFIHGIVNISSIRPHKIPKYTIANSIYFDWQSTIYGLEKSLSNIMIGFD